MIAQRQLRALSAVFGEIAPQAERPVVSRRAIALHHDTEGGDWSEAFPLSPTHLAISIGDVCGHDAEASEIMTHVRSDVRLQARVSRDPAHVLRAVNATLFRRAWPSYATAIFGVIDLEARTLVFSSAGHPAPYIVEPRGSHFLRAPASVLGGMPLGVAPSLKLDVRTVTLVAGALVVFYTDGVTEIEHDWRLGERRLRAAVRYAYRRPYADAAGAIALHIDLAARRRDDASILTVRMRA